VTVGQVSVTSYQGPVERAPASKPRGRIAIPLVCGVVGACLFLPAIASGWLADDFGALHTVHEVRNVLWPFAHNNLGQPAGFHYFYRPLWVLWTAALYGLSHNALLAHAGNLVLFGLICAEVAVLVWYLTDQWWKALLGGLLFAVFPSHGESVAWINGDQGLIAVVLGLLAVIIAVAGRPSFRRCLAIAVLNCLAMLAMEIAFLFPFLTAILLYIRPPNAPAPAPGRLGRWRAPLAMLAGVVVVLIARSFVISGLGGYGPHFTPKRGLGSLLSFSLGALSAPQLQMLANPVLLLVPALLAGLIAWRLYRLWRDGAHERLKLALAGCAWFVLALVPVLNEPLNLNTRTGDRELLLPSVGLILAAVAMLPSTRTRAATLGAAALIAACATSCVANAFDWSTAGRESRRILAELHDLAPPRGELVVLSVPSDYRAAHLFPDSLVFAVQQDGRPDTLVTTCAPVHALKLVPKQVSFERAANGAWLGSATSNTPFDVPVLGGTPPTADPNCIVTKPATSVSPSLGTALSLLVDPKTPGRIPTRYVYFDGLNMRPVRAG
jgi:hypothetical protein